MDHIDSVVVGAGVVGLSAARALALRGHEVLLIEAEESFGMGTSSRNSEVIHAGIYYPKGSIKARACVAGRAMLYDYLASRHVPHKKLGKLIVAANSAQEEALAAIKAKAEGNGVEGMRYLSAAEISEKEPNIRVAAALWSPETGILDTHAYMQALLGDLEASGGQFVPHTPFLRAKVIAEGFHVEVGGAEPFAFTCSRLVNAGGLGAQGVAKGIEGLEAKHIPPLFYARGAYFVMAGKSPFSHLVYPVPEPGGLGVHVTLDMGGQARFGPDVEWIDSVDYTLKPERGEKFYAAVRAYFPDLKDGALLPGYTGIRPKLVGPGEPDADFVIQGEETHGVKGLVNLFGIESPGLTSSLWLGQEVAKLF